MFILNRPLEIMILVALNAIAGAILMLNGLSTGGVEFPPGLPPLGSGLLPLIGGIMGILGAFELPIGLAFFGSAAGLFLGKGWGWTMSRALQIAGIAFSFGFLYDAGGQLATMGLYTLGMAISGVVVGFLYAPEVKEFYGKNATPRPTKRQRRKRKQEQLLDDEQHGGEEELDGQEPSSSSSAAEVE